MADIRFEFGGDDLQKYEKLLKEIQKAAKSLRDTIKSSGKTLETDAAKAKEYAKATTRLKNEKNKLSAVEKEALRIKRRTEQVDAKLLLSQSKEAQVLKQKEAQLRKVNREMRVGTKNTNKWATALGSFQFKFNALGNIAANVTSQLTRVMRNAFRSMVDVIRTFDQAMADVRAITGAVGKDFDALRENAKKLGATTKFTAAEVAQLEKEFAKLGFSTKEILAASEATLSLAAATNTELPRAAEVAGITIRQFGLDASETQRVVDVMAKSFTTSALDMEKFAESMKFVGPAAKATGLSIEEATTYLAQLANAGISGSMAGTSLRQIMLALSKESGTFQEKIQRAARSGLDLAGATDEVQKRAATALLVMADGIDDVDEFTRALENAGGAAEKMANEQLDTLNGQLTILNSAWEGFVIAIGDAEGAIDGAKDSIETMSNALNVLTRLLERSRDDEDILSKVADGAQKTRKSVVASLPVVGKLFRIFQVGAASINIAANSMEDLAEATDDLEGASFDANRSIGDLHDTIFNGGDFKQTWLWDLTQAIGDIAREEREEAIKELQKLLTETWERLQMEAGQAASGFLDEDDGELLPPLFDPKKTQEQGDEYLDILKGLSSSRSEALNEDLNNEVKATEEAEDLKRKKMQATFDFASRAAETFTQLFESQKQKELSAAGDNAEKRLEIEKKYSRRQKTIAIAQAIISGAQSIQKTKAQLGIPAAIPFMIIDAALTAAQVGIIASQKFAKGGAVRGEPHSRGGVHIEAEGGEYVINRRSTAKYKDLVEAINQDDRVRILDAMSRDRKIKIDGSGDPYTRKIYDHMKREVNAWEDNEFYYVRKGNITRKFHKN